ncbi:MAG: TatD family hydrolase [Bacteroidota bacterium]|nr:TatD family hydrolase [Candidatus Kapabacteria bacterium]MDW8219588.1 TatD family hydrolase [Bacteroidota bacterium]
MIDTHCHLDHKRFDNDRHDVLERAFASGITHILVPAIEPQKFHTVLALAESNQRIVCAMGIHPHHAHQATNATLAQVEELSYNENVCAIGEIGLDYHYHFAPHDVQRHVFRQQLRIAKKRRLPVIIHNRESDEDMMRILQEEQDGALEGVLHCFSGTPEQAHRALHLGFHLSFTGNITFPDSSLQETVASTPLDRIMLETDAPYMTPVPHRGKRNEPSFIRFIAEAIAQAHSSTLENVIQYTSITAQRLFRLSILIVGILLFSALWCSPIQIHAQTDDTDEEYTELPHPFPKVIGAGVCIGANTLTDFTTGGTGFITPYAGQALGPGASLSFFLSHHWALQASYIYGINYAVTAINPQTGMPRQINPNEHQAFDISVLYNTNPWNILNFYFLAGASYLINNINLEGARGYVGFHLNFIGLGINIKTPIGIIYPNVEFRVNMVVGLQNERKRYGQGDERPLYGFVFSVPRIGVHFFPNFSSP